MYEFLKKNFEKSEDFIRVASKSAYITWSIPDGKVIKSEDLHLIPFFTEKTGFDCETAEINHICQLIPKDLYLFIRKKLDYFFSIHKRKFEKKYILAFALNYFNKKVEGPNKIFVNIETNIKTGIASIVITHLEAVSELNHKIMIIYEALSESSCKIVGVISLSEQSDLYLKNYEYDILQLISQGFQSDTIAPLLNVSKHTVDDCRKNLLNKFQSKNIYQLIANAYQEGFI